MAVVSVVKLSELEGAKRIDAEYYQPEYIKFVHSLKNIGSIVTLKKMGCEVVSGPFGSSLKSESYRTSGVPFIRIQNLQSLFIAKDDLVFISEEDNQRLKSSQLKVGDLILSKVGNTIGVVSIITSDIGRCNISENNIGIKFKYHSESLKKYLAVYLNTKYGKQQILRLISGNAQPKLNVYDIYNLALFITPDSNLIEDISNKVNEIYDTFNLSIRLYSQAENLLLEELELKDFKPKYELSYTANLSQAFNVHRIDAEYFQPMYREIEEHLTKNFETLPIKKIRYIGVTTGQYTENYVSKEEGKPYIRGTDISNGTINTDSLVYISPEDQIESKKAKEGDVVVTRVGTIGLSARIPKECDGGTLSDNLIRIRIFDEMRLNSYYLALYLGGPIGTSLMIRNSRGSVQQRLNQETLKEVIIPILPPETQQKIALLVQQSHSARRKAKELLEEAKRKVEEAIENEIRK